jgi:hypothetical protein
MQGRYQFIASKHKRALPNCVRTNSNCLWAANHTRDEEIPLRDGTHVNNNYHIHDNSGRYQHCSVVPPSPPLAPKFSVGWRQKVRAMCDCERVHDKHERVLPRLQSHVFGPEPLTQTLKTSRLLLFPASCRFGDPSAHTSGIRTGGMQET